jgi:hypothetical protein
MYLCHAHAAPGEDGPPPSLTFSIGRDFHEPTGVQQGIATDGKHIYVQSTFELVKCDMKGKVIARSGKLDLHHGGITCLEGKIYAAASECAKEGTKVHQVRVYDAETLEKVAEHDIGGHFGVCAGGIAYFEDHFYVAESYFDNDHDDYIVMYDREFKRVTSFTVDFKCPYGIQGLAYIPSLKKFLVNSHGKPFYLIDTNFDSKTLQPGQAPFELQDVANVNPTTLLLNDRDNKRIVFAHLEVKKPETGQP